MSEKSKSYQAKINVPLYTFRYDEELFRTDWFDPEIAKSVDEANFGDVIHFQNPIGVQDDKLFAILERYPIGDIKAALGRKSQYGDRNGIYDLLRGARVRPTSMENLVGRIVFYDDIVKEKFYAGELTRKNLSLKNGLDHKKEKLREQFREIIEYLIEINQPGVPNMWGLSTAGHIQKLTTLATNPRLTAVQIQNIDRFLEELAMFLTNKQVNNLFEKCDRPILTENGIEFISQNPLDKFGGLERKRRRSLRK